MSVYIPTHLNCPVLKFLCTHPSPHIGGRSWAAIGREPANSWRPMGAPRRQNCEIQAYRKHDRFQFIIESLGIKPFESIHSIKSKLDQAGVHKYILNFSKSSRQYEESVSIYVWEKYIKKISIFWSWIRTQTCFYNNMNISTFLNNKSVWHRNPCICWL